MLWSLSCTSW